MSGIISKEHYRVPRARPSTRYDRTLVYDYRQFTFIGYFFYGTPRGYSVGYSPPSHNSQKFLNPNLIYINNIRNLRIANSTHKLRKFLEGYLSMGRGCFI